MTIIEVKAGSPTGSIPIGGDDGQVLVKLSDLDFDYGWESVAGVGAPAWADITGKPSTFPPATHTHVIADTTGLQTALDGKQPLATVLTNTTAAFTTAQETKLSGIAAGATANATDAQLRDRSTHTGTQLAATISDLNTAVDARIGLASVNALADVIVSTPSVGQVLKYNGTNWVNDVDSTSGGAGATNLSVVNRTTTTLDVASDTGTDATIPVATTALAGLQSSADKTKLDGIATGATANATDAQLRDRGTHTGTQTASTISDFNTAADARITAAVGTSVQAYDGDLAAIAALAGTSGLARKTAANTWSLDTATYLTTNQTITATGDATGSGTTSLALTIPNDTVTFAKMQNIATSRILGRTTASAGDIEELTVGSGLSLTAGTLTNPSFITVSTTAPASPVVNQLWLDIN